MENETAKGPVIVPYGSSMNGLKTYGGWWWRAGKALGLLFIILTLGISALLLLAGFPGSQ